MFDLYYQLFRRKGRTLLSVGLAVVLCACMAFYMGNIRSNQEALNSLAENIPVVARVVNRDASKEDELNVSTELFDRLTQAPVKNIHCTALAAGALEEKAQAQKPFIGGDVSVVAANSLGVLEVPVEAVAFAPGTDEGMFGQDQGLCAADTVFAQENGIEIGGTLDLPMYTMVWNQAGIRYLPLGKVQLEVAALLDSSQSGGTLGDIYVPTAWLRSQAEGAGADFYYSSLNVELEDPGQLNQFKESLPTMGFMEPTEDVTDLFTGDAVSVEDEMFIKTAGQLQRNLATFQRFLFSFLGLVVGLTALITFLLLRGARRDIAIAISLGKSKFQTGLSYVLVQVLSQLVGCVLLFPVMEFALNLSPGSCLAVCGSFLLCGGAGAVLAMLLLLRFDVMALLLQGE